MKELSKIQIASLVICISSALFAIVVMINQVNLTSKTANIIAENNSLRQQESDEIQQAATKVISNLNSEETTQEQITSEEISELGKKYVLNKSSKKIHSPDCRYAENIKEDNREELVTDNIGSLLNGGYDICSACEAQ